MSTLFTVSIYERRCEIQTTNIEHHKGYHLSSQLVIWEIKLIEVLCPFLKLCKNFFINSLMRHNYCKIYFLKKDLYVQPILPFLKPTYTSATLSILLIPLIVPMTKIGSLNPFFSSSIILALWCYKALEPIAQWLKWKLLQWPRSATDQCKEKAYSIQPHTSFIQHLGSKVKHGLCFLCHTICSDQGWGNF